MQSRSGGRGGTPTSSPRLLAICIAGGKAKGEPGGADGSTTADPLSFPPVAFVNGPITLHLAMTLCIKSAEPCGQLLCRRGFMGRRHKAV